LAVLDFTGEMPSTLSNGFGDIYGVPTAFWLASTQQLEQKWSGWKAKNAASYRPCSLQ